MISKKEIRYLNYYWQAVNYLSAAQIYLQNNPLLKEPLKVTDIKPRLLGHWGTCPGLNLIYIHLNRLIKTTGASILFIAGPGHGAPAVYANTYLEGSYSKANPSVSLNEQGIRKLIRQFSIPGGVPSHISAIMPGAIHEGGELGYSLAHAIGAVFDNPDLIAACVIGDGEAETAALEGSWKSIRFLNPKKDGTVLPILHLNGYKISSASIMARMENNQLKKLLEGYGYRVQFIEDSNPMHIHQSLAIALNKAYKQITILKEKASGKDSILSAKYPLIVLRTPKGWTGPKEWKGTKIEGTIHAHQVPLENVKNSKAQFRLLEKWLRSYHPEKLFDNRGRLISELTSLLPDENKRMGMNPHANGGNFLQELILPSKQKYAVRVGAPGHVHQQGTKELGKYIRDIFRLNKKQQQFRLFCPDETNSNKLEAAFEATDRFYTGKKIKTDEHLSSQGRIMEVLSEHLCQGWMEGYLLTGRHGLFVCYEAFITIIDSMFSQYAKWLKQCGEITWRKELPSFNYLLTSHTWRQDHNGYSHQGPGFIETVINKKSDIIRIYLPPDANCLLCVMEHCFTTKNKINLIVAGKQPALQWLSIKQAETHCQSGISVWKWASNDQNKSPHVILACAGDVPTIETIAAAWLLKQQLPQLKIRVVNIINLMALSPIEDHPHGLTEKNFASIFTEETVVVFAFHGYRRIIHDLIHGRPNPARFHVRGYNEEGTTTTPFDMTVLNGISRYHLAIDAIKKSNIADSQKTVDFFEQKLKQHHIYIREHLDDMPEVKEWKWS